MIAGDKDWLSQYSLLDEEPLREVEEVDKVETVTMDVVLDTIAPYNVPVVEEISFPSPDQVTAPEDRSCCPNSGIQIMNWGNRVGSSSNINFSVEFPSKDSMDVDTFIRLTLPKPTMRMRTRKHDCAVLSQAPNYQRRTAGWTLDKYMGPLADSLAKIDSGDGDEDKQTDAMVDNILPSSK